jgi:alpha-ketoglutarate-dependent 2,4-dichlorophenoxyacetate dioxygenase
VDLMHELERHATQDDNVYYHQWRPGDVVIWDEHATMHRNAGDFPPEQRRIMLRAMVNEN